MACFEKGERLVETAAFQEMGQLRVHRRRELPGEEGDALGGILELLQMAGRVAGVKLTIGDERPAQAQCLGEVSGR